MDKKYESYLLIEKNLLREHNFFWLQTSAKNERRSSTKSVSAREIFFKIVRASESAVFWDEREHERNVF